MLSKKIVAGALAVLMTVGMTGAKLNVATLDANYGTQAKLSEKIDVPSKNYDLGNATAASYRSISWVSALGSPITVSVTNDSFVFECANCSSIDVEIVSTNNYGHSLFNQSGTSSVSVSVLSQLNKNEVYNVFLDYVVDGIAQHQEEIYITNDNGRVAFVQSPIYDFNVERCSELWTDAESLQECLQPQNDVECDNPEVIRIASMITSGCSNDWEKAYAIYEYIVGEIAYDYVQTEDESMVYQDDVLSLCRRKVAICEGMGNMFTALCRASGIPACVSFGIGETAANFMSDSSFLTEEWPNHAWAMVCLDGSWYSIDPTWDCNNEFNGSSYATGVRTDAEPGLEWYLIPIEIFSMTHKICDADTTHGIEERGSCGSSASYVISRDGTLTVSGSGEFMMPEFVNGYSRVVFDDNCTITSIGEECFIDRDIVTQIILPDSVKRIEKFAFNTCEDLEYIYLPDGLEYIGQEAFDYCDELAYVYIPDSVTEIGNYAFDDCPRLIISVPSHLDLHEENYYVQPLRVIYR